MVHVLLITRTGLVVTLTGPSIWSVIRCAEEAGYDIVSASLLPVKA